jgi:hypothetical protein
MANLLCPLRLMARESDWDIIDNCGWVEDGWQASINCLGNQCAFWNESFGMCAVTAIAMAMTLPVELGRFSSET